VVHTNDELQMIGLGAESRKDGSNRCGNVRKILDDGEAGDNVGLLLRGVDKKEIKRGMVLAKPVPSHPIPNLKHKYIS